MNKRIPTLIFIISRMSYDFYFAQNYKWIALLNRGYKKHDLVG
jgi:hypothetical protein